SPAAGASAAGRSRTHRAERAVEQGGERGRHVQVRRGAAGAVRRSRAGRVQADHRVLPDRRAFLAHLVRPARAAWLLGREELRRFVDRVRLAGRGADRARRRAGERGMSAGTQPAAVAAGCAAPDQSAPLVGVDLAKETVITGVVRADDRPVAGAYVRLLDASGEFSADVVSYPEGVFRYFAAPGQWTVRALSRQGTGEVTVKIGRSSGRVCGTVQAVAESRW